MAMALAQPLLDLLARHPAFLVAHRASPLLIGLVAGVLMIGPPLVDVDRQNKLRFPHHRY